MHHPEKLRVAVVEDESLFREMLCMALSRDEAIEVVGDFAGGETALKAIPHLRPHVIMLDIELSGEMNGIELGLLLRQQLPDLGVVVLSNHGAPGFLSSLLPEAAAGWSFLRKKSVRDFEALARAIRGSAKRQIVLDPHLVSERRPYPDGALARLTPRQQEVLQFIAQGFNNLAIAERLGLTAKTVENIINSLYLELLTDEARSSSHARVQAVLIYLQETGTLKQEK